MEYLVDKLLISFYWEKKYSPAPGPFIPGGITGLFQ